MQLALDDRFINELPADPQSSTQRRQVESAAFSFVTPRVPSKPRLLHMVKDVAAMVGIDESDVGSDEFTAVFSGAVVPKGARPYAMCYGGHQFGSWAGQLGDGRAINLAEVRNQEDHYTLQLKGAGETPYSRTADGLAVLRSSVREHLCSEAMFHLGVPTTRSLSLITTGDPVMRDMMYDGNPAYEPGAVVCRVAPSFVRFGSFEIFASRGDKVRLKELLDYTIKHFFPECETSRSGYIDFYRLVARRTMAMIVDWQRVGFVHGVMNTDNMSIHGLTIDYGPYGWLEGYDPDWTPNTTDRQFGRYRYGNQPEVAMWNLAKLASALLSIVEEVEPLQEILEECQRDFPIRYNEMMAAKLGLDRLRDEDEQLIHDLEEVLPLTETDMTIFFRGLAMLDLQTDWNAANGSDSGHDWLSNLPETLADAFYVPSEIQGDVAGRWHRWFCSYLQRLRYNEMNNGKRIASMNQVNPKYVLRNYMAQMAIDQAEAGDLTLVNELYELLRSPYDTQPAMERWFAKRPDWARHKVGCSMLSCSS